MKTYETWKHEDWDRAHREKDVSALTGTGLDPHILTLGAQDLVNSTISLLCIGVGTGQWVWGAVERYARIEALDISKEAARSLPRGLPLHTDPATLPSNTFDLALSLWVAPHMSNHDLEVQIREVVRSLKPSGVFAMHYKEPLTNSAVVDNREGAEDEWRLTASAGALRRRGHLEQMVQWSGGKVIKVAAEYPSMFYSIREVSVHIGKAG